MQNHYIVRLKDNSLYCFYQLKEKGIFYKIYEKNKWAKEKVLIENGRENFTVCSDEKDIYIFCQDRDGNIILCKGREEKWENRTILENQSGKVNIVLFNPILVKNGLCLIYNMPSLEDRSQYLVRQHVVDGKWSQALHIDKFTNMDFYQLQYITREHCVLYYQTGTGDNKLGYREVTSKHVGDYHVFHTTPYTVADASFLATNSSVHVLYIVRGMFGSRLTYKKKDGNQFGAPIVLLEGQRIENCLLSIIKNNIYATFSSGGRILYCVSEDRGVTFSRPAQYKNKMCTNPVKAVYRSDISQHENNFFCREVYVDQNNPWDIQMLPELYEDFYPVEEVRESRVSDNTRVTEAGDWASIEKEDYFLLKKQLLHTQKQLEEKDRQIIHLSKRIASLDLHLNAADGHIDGSTDLGQ